MMCIKCANKTKVLDTKLAEHEYKRPKSKHTLKLGDRIFGWWSTEFTMRKRQCYKCHKVFWTIEVVTKDLEDAFTEASENESMGMPWLLDEIADEIQREFDEAEIPTVNDISWRTMSNLVGDGG